MLVILLLKKVCIPNYLTCDISIGDARNLLGNLPILGGEAITIKMCSSHLNDQNPTHVIEQSFIIHSISNRTFKDDREQIVVGQLIAELTLPLNIVNFEGISTRSDVNGGVIIYLISDDNFNSRQRTLLMVFEFKRNERNLSKVIFSHY